MRFWMCLALIQTFGTALPLAAQPVGAPSRDDSLGLVALNRTFDLLPGITYGTELTLKSLSRIAPGVKPTAVASFGVAYTLAGRTDGIVLGFGFDWTSEEIVEGTRTDDPAVAELYFEWSGKDAEQFRAVVDKFGSAMRMAASAPICVDYGSNVSTTQRARRSREAAWVAGGWLGHVIVRATADSSLGESFIIQYNVSRLPGRPWRAPAEPRTISWDCLPSISEILPVRR